MSSVPQYLLVYEFAVKKLKLLELSIQCFSVGGGNKFGKMEVTFFTDGASVTIVTPSFFTINRSNPRHLKGLTGLSPRQEMEIY